MVLEFLFGNRSFDRDAELSRRPREVSPLDKVLIPDLFLSDPMNVTIDRSSFSVSLAEQCFGEGICGTGFSRYWSVAMQYSLRKWTQSGEGRGNCGVFALEAGKQRKTEKNKAKKERIEWKIEGKITVCVRF